MWQLTRIAGTCPDGNICPTISTTNRGTVVVQGYTLAGDELARIGLPAGESAIEIPVSLLEEVVRAYRR